MEAREWADKHNLRFVWADDWDVPHIDETHAGVETCEWVALMDDEGNILDSVSCIDDADDDYRRSIEADLMQDVAPRESTCGECGRTWFYDTPASRCPWEYDHVPYAEVSDETPTRPTLLGEAERLLGYWSRHVNHPEVVAKWAMQDLMAILRQIVDEQS